MTPNPESSKKLLIIENNPLILEGLGTALSEAGYAVELASNGCQALHYLRDQPSPDLILLDMMLPDIDGWRFLQVRRQLPKASDIPVLIVTGLSAASPEWAASLGAAGLVRKPFEFETLVQKVRQCLA